MSKDMRTAMRAIWTASCQDKPLPSNHDWTIEDGDFVIRLKGQRDRWEDLLAAAGTPRDAERCENGDTLIVSWPSWADRLFAAGGMLAQYVDGYEVREPQLQAARIWQRAIEMRDVAVIEGATGTGKSFMYLGIALAMRKRVVVSTSNKALQVQIVKKDAPFLNQIIRNGEAKIALVQGKNNYICANLAEQGGRNTIESPMLRDWYEKTENGNFEEIEFEVDPRERSRLTVATGDCLGRQCPLFHRCFYYEQKAQLADADIIVCNHTLLIMNKLYPNANILPPVSAVVVDEAHQLPNYVRSALGTEIPLSRIKRIIDTLDAYVGTVDIMVFVDYENEFYDEIKAIIGRSVESQIQIHTDVTMEAGKKLAGKLLSAADLIWNNADMPNNPHEKAEQNKANRVRNMADKIWGVSIPSKDGFVRWIQPQDDVTLCYAPFEVAPFISFFAGFDTVNVDPGGTYCEGEIEEDAPTYTHCTRCHRQLTAESVYILGSKPFGPTCIGYVDVLGDAEQVKLSDWLAMKHEETAEEVEAPKIDNGRNPWAVPVLFTSATIAAPEKKGRRVERTFTRVMREFGLPEAMQMIADTPFDHENNCMVFIPNATKPNPKGHDFENFVINQIDELVRASNGGALVLFTSYRMMRMAHEALAHDFIACGLNIYMQGGELTKGETIKRFAEDGNAVLFATKSFFEGVDVKGEALRLVIIDKLPYAAPSPLRNAADEHLREWARKELGLSGKSLESYPFFNVSVPDMLTELQQAHGRLIRSQTDRGVVALLDNRARSPWLFSLTQAAMPGYVTDRMFMVDDFLNPRKESQPVAELSPLEQFELVVGD